MDKRPIIKCIYDPNFKSIFIENPNALASLISSITGINYNLMKDNISIKVNEIPISSQNEKFKRCDFIVNFDNYMINVEVNGFSYESLKMKNTSYAMKLYSENAKSGEDYNTNLVLIQINLNAFFTNKKVLTEYYLSDPKTGEIFLRNFAVYTLDVAKCYKLFYNLDVNEITDYIRWGAFLYSDNLNELKDILGGMLSLKDTNSLIGKVEEINMKRDGTLTKKEAREWGKWIENAMKEKGYNEGLEQGIQEGREVGFEEGREEGREIGFKEGIINTIKLMLKNKADYEFISKVTNKSIEEIKEIEKTI